MKDIVIGGKYNMLTVIRYSHSDSGQRYWECLCDCGSVKCVKTADLNFGRLKSCGCQKYVGCKEAATTHGMRKTRIYDCWSNMKRRCNDKNNKRYAQYGGRGICYDQKWESFEGFFEDMGETYSDTLTLERIDVDGNYCKDNCRWASIKEQARNKRKQSNNTSNFTGVCWRLYTNGYTYAAAFWKETDGKRKMKQFNVAKFGLLESFYMACIYRQKMISILRSNGDIYSEKHGL